MTGGYKGVMVISESREPYGETSTIGQARYGPSQCAKFSLSLRFEVCPLLNFGYLSVANSLPVSGVLDFFLF